MKTITQTARKAFINCLDVYDLQGDELCRLEFDPGNDSLIADRIYLVDSNELLYGQLELPLPLKLTYE